MNPENPPPLAGANEEVIRLIETLHMSGRRLEDLTGGEVDAVTDAEGHTVLLRRAQDKLRHSEAAKQAAILNSLPAHIALLDVHGVIISANAAWTRYPCEGVTHGAGHGLGLNYLDICDSARGNHTACARQIADGVRAVLGGGVDSFSLEYTCGPPTEQYWFQLTVTPLGHGLPHGAVVMHLDITEQKRHQESLRQSKESLEVSESRFRQMAESIRDVFFLIEVESNRTLYVSPAYEEIWGRSCESVYADADAWSEAIHPDQRESIQDKYRTGIAEGHFDFEYRIVRPDGSFRWIEARGFPVRDAAGRMIRIAGVAADITQRKLAEDAILREKDFTAAMLDSLPGLFYVINEQGRFLRWNRNFEIVSGYSSAEMSQLAPSHFFGEEDQQRVAATIAQVFTSGHATVEADFVAKDQGKTPHFFTGKLAQIEDKPCLIGMGLDISKRKLAEQELRESERRFSDMLGNVELISLMLDREGRVTYCNDYFLRLTGWQHAEVVGRDWFALFVPPEIHDLRYDLFQTLIADAAETLHPENEILTRAGERRLIRWNNAVLRSGTGEVVGQASIGEDITEQKRAEIRIKRLNRVYAVLSGINTLIVRVRDREALFREACAIAVKAGHFQLAWIGILNPDSHNVDPVAWAGDEQGHLSLVRTTAGTARPGTSGLARRAIETRKSVVCNDIESDTEILAYPKEALARGYRSAIALPLFLGGEAVGALHLYAGEADFFDEQEMVLLDELAGDISFALEHIGKSDQLEYLAYYDELTGLANSTLFRERIGQLSGTAVQDKKQFVVAIFDVERFKTINDTLGRLAGDRLLEQIAERTRRAIVDVNWIARIGGDHFAKIFPSVTGAEDAARHIRHKYHEIFDKPFDVDGTELRVAARVGIAMFPNDGADAETLLQNAESALKKAKATGERFMFYTQQMGERVAERLSLENKLRGALENKEFVLHYQPKIDLTTGGITGVEALIRWNDPATGLVPPAHFIPLLEETGLILEVGSWAMIRAVLDHRRWLDRGLVAPRIAVNVSPVQLQQRDFVEVVKQAIAFGASPPGIDLEITESLIMSDMDSNIAKLVAIHELGITIFIDDFGTGYSSLGYLARLPVQSLKIDRSFVITMMENPNTMSLVRTIISLAHSMKLKVVAEGVDKDEQAQILKLLRCDEMQGYLFSKPVPRDEFETMFLVPNELSKTAPRKILQLSAPAKLTDTA